MRRWQDHRPGQCPCLMIRRGGGRQGRVSHVGRRGALYRSAVAGGGGRAADRGRGSESRTLCDKQIRVDLLGGGSIGGWLSAVQRETVMTGGGGYSAGRQGNGRGGSSVPKRRVWHVFTVRPRVSGGRVSPSPANTWCWRPGYHGATCGNNRGHGKTGHMINRHPGVPH